ncbi:MAG: DUF169 domain-containing protein [Proteobacteria bacterium]|jgi:uncharacterized protein (DUF169 family)|nr:DUF169 domain-containing protein [Pseudomonadota bacterium]MBW2554769.1 DUF169 domain-containing protein [Deltaproteobacteria bacterium]MCK5420704.1 DUF169 domain-containing protein [Deltaproteobacteria bacterium]
MTKDKLIHTLKEDLKIKKEIIAVKAMKQAPSDIPQYEGQASPGMCAFVGEILKDGSVWYATKENLGCFEALTGTGTCENMPRDKYMEFMIEQNQSYPMHKNADVLVEYYDKVDDFFKHPKVDGTGIVVGPLLRVDDPDLVLLFVTPHQADILSRARAYLGDFTRGFAGMGGCIFTIRYTFDSGDPSFSTSDTAWRMFAGLDEDELTYTFPYPKLLEIADRIKPTAEYVNGFKSMF